MSPLSLSLVLLLCTLCVLFRFTLSQSAEILELAGNAYNADDVKRAATVLPCDIQAALRCDEELDRLCTRLNISNIDYIPVFQLTSGVDGKVTELKLSTLMTYWHSDNTSRSSAFSFLSNLNCSSTELNVIIPNVSSAAIKVVYDWHFGIGGCNFGMSINFDTGTSINTFVPSILFKSTDRYGKIISDTKKLEQLEQWKIATAADPTLYAHVLMACDFLGCDKMSNELFQSFEDSGIDPIVTIRSCFQIIPNFASMLLYRGLCVPSEQHAFDFLTNLTTKNVQELTYW